MISVYTFDVNEASVLQHRDLEYAYKATSQLLCCNLSPLGVTYADNVYACVIC